MKPHKEPKKGENWRKGYQAGQKETIAEFIAGRRCIECGDIKEADTLDSCGKCIKRIESYYDI